MAITLTTSYQKISTINVRYGQIRTYAKYNSQSTANNTTTISLKTTYYLSQWISFSSGTSVLDGNSKGYGSTRLNAGETTLQEFTRTIYHNADGTSPNKNVATSWTASYGGGGSTSADVVAPKILRQATITSASDFNDEQNPSMKYSNPAGNSVTTLRGRIELPDNTILVGNRDLNKTGTSYTFNLTDAERNTLRNATPNSNTLSLKYVVETVIGSSTFWSVVYKTMTIVNGNPTFTHSEVETNSVVSDALGSTSADTIVQNLSNVKVTVVPSAKKSSTIKQVQVTHSGTTYTDTTSPYEFNIKPLANSLDIKVTDSRGNTASQTATKTMLNYAPVKINSFSFKRRNPTSSDIIVNLGATYWNTNIGDVTNAPVVQWKMGSEGTLTTIPNSSITIDNTNHKITVSNYTLSNQLVYTSGETFYIYVNDAFSETSNNRFVTKGIPVFDLGDDEVQVNGALYIANTSEENKRELNRLLISSGSGSDLNALFETGMYHYGPSISNVPNNDYGVVYVLGRVKVTNAFWVYQIAFSAGGGVFVRRNINDLNLNSWTAWEGVHATPNLVSGGSAIKAGYKVDGKDVYVKRLHFSNINGTNTYNVATGLTVNNIQVIKMEGVTYTNINNYQPIPFGDWNNATTYGIRLMLSTNNNLQLQTLNSNFKQAWVNIYYINK